MSITLTALQKQRRDTAANWTAANPTLLAGELGYESDTGKWKVGDGTTAWTSLAYTYWSQISAYPLATADIADDAITAAKLADTAVTAGSYTAADITVDAQGRVTAAASGTISTAEIADGAVTSAKLDTNITIAGDLTVNGTTTTINSTTLTVDDKNIELGSVATPTDTTADGGGITLKGATDKTINWVQSTTAWTFSEHVNIASAKEFRIAGTKVLDATSLGSAVVTSSLTSVGTITTGVWNGTAIATAYIADDAVTADKLADTSVTAAGYGSASQVGTFTVDAQGRLTAAADVSIAIGASAITSGTLAVDRGGTGQASYTNGQLLIGNSTGNTLSKATLTAGSNITITNGAGSIEIAGTAGTVTSVDVSGGTGLTATGGPITSSGTISVSLDDTAVTPGSYTAADITVDAQGRITAASSGSAGAGDKITEGNTEAEVVDTGSDGHFKVTTEGVERIRVGPAGQIGIAGANYGTTGQLLSSGGASGVVAWVDAVVIVDGGNFANGSSLATSSGAIDGGSFT